MVCVFENIVQWKKVRCLSTDDGRTKMWILDEFAIHVIWFLTSAYHWLVKEARRPLNLLVSRPVLLNNSQLQLPPSPNIPHQEIQNNGQKSDLRCHRYNSPIQCLFEEKRGKIETSRIWVWALSCPVVSSDWWRVSGFIWRHHNSLANDSVLALSCLHNWSVLHCIRCLFILFLFVKRIS